MPASSAQTVNVSGPMLTAVPVVSMAGSLSAIGVNAAPVCVPVTTMSAAQEPSSCFVGATFVELNVRSGNEVTRSLILLPKPALSNNGRGRAWGPTNWSVAASATCSVVHVSALPAMGSPSKKMAMLSGGEATGSAGGAAVASVPSATVVTLAPSSVSSFVDSAAPSAIVASLLLRGERGVRTSRLSMAARGSFLLEQKVGQPLRRPPRPDELLRGGAEAGDGRARLHAHARGRTCQISWLLCR